MADIEPYKKKKVDKDAEGKPFVMKNDVLTKASGAPDAKINGIGTMDIEPDGPAEPPEPGKYVTSPKDFNQLLRDAFEAQAASTFREMYHAEYTKTADGPMRQSRFEGGQTVRVSLDEAIRKEFEFCRKYNEPISFHVRRMLGYIDQYINNQK